MMNRDLDTDFPLVLNATMTLTNINYGEDLISSANRETAPDKDLSRLLEKMLASEDNEIVYPSKRLESTDAIH